MDSLVEEFRRRIALALNESLDKKLVTHTIERMLSRNHAEEVAKQLTNPRNSSSEIQSGLKKIAKAKHLHLSFESIMLEPHFMRLFKTENLEVARWHLREADSTYSPPSNLTEIDIDNIPSLEANNQIKTQSTIYERDPDIVRKVKERAIEGKCELCNEQGFETIKGGFYLEAHHVIPLNCDGPDEIWNVVAICANDHKRAHFGENLIQIRDQLIEILTGYYPDKKQNLISLAKKMDTRNDIKNLLELDAFSK